MKDFLISVPALAAGFQVNPKERLVVVPEQQYRELVKKANMANKPKRRKGKKKKK